MKKSILVGLLLVGMLFALPSHAQTSESVASFNATLLIHQDASVSVTEQVVYDFGSNQRHGIYREIPVSYQTELGNTSIKISNIAVVDEAGYAYPFTLDTIGRDEEIKIGDPNALVSGSKTYVITYTAERALGYFTDYDELYWNVTGNGWKVPIAKARAEFVLPALIASSSVRTSCYQGVYGDTNACGSAVVGAPNEKGDAVRHVYFSSDNLNPGEGLTGAVGFPKGLVYQPTPWQNFLQLLSDNGVLGLPLLVCIGMFALWYRKGRDPKGRGVVIAEYESPDSLTPIEMSALQSASVKNSALSGEIIYLATKGYLSITRTETKTLFFKSHDYVLRRLKPSGGLPQFDSLLLDGIFTTDEIKLSELKNKFYSKLPAIKKTVMLSVVDKKYYPTDPQKVVGLYFAGGIALGFISAFVASSMDAGVLGIASGIVSGLIVVLFALIMPKVTPEGAVAKEKAQGLKLYLTVAEKDRINFHNAPDKNPQLFEKLLPFAMVLGVEAAWAKQFEGIYLEPPSWYNDPYSSGFNSVLFANSMQTFTTSARSTLTSAPQGASGSGGGGFSGGGGGGGGGGSW